LTEFKLGDNYPSAKEKKSAEAKVGKWKKEEEERERKNRAFAVTIERLRRFTTQMQLAYL